MDLTQIYSYDELVKEHKVTYVAGGASQNAARGAAVSSEIFNKCFKLKKINLNSTCFRLGQ